MTEILMELGQLAEYGGADGRICWPIWDGRVMRDRTFGSADGALMDADGSDVGLEQRFLNKTKVPCTLDEDPCVFTYFLITPERPCPGWFGGRQRSCIADLADDGGGSSDSVGADGSSGFGGIQFGRRRLSLDRPRS